MKPSEFLTAIPIEPTWIVHDLIPCGTLLIIAGEAGAGKSSLMYWMSYAIASGQPFLGHATSPTRVQYFDEENAEPDFLRYNQWSWIGTGQVPLETLDQWLDIQHFHLIENWRSRMTDCVTAFRPGLVIIDTASSAFQVVDENANSEAIGIIRFLRRLKEVVNPAMTIIVLKHEKQRSEVGHRRTIRGAKVWLGAFDQVLYHVIAPGARRRKDGTRKTILEPEKLRAYGLRHRIGINPTFTETEPNGLILNTYPLLQEGDEEPAP